MVYPNFRKIVEDTDEQRETFFKLAFGPQADGYICISYLNHLDRKMNPVFFKYPEKLNDLLASIKTNSEQLVHVYFCPNLYGSPGNKSKQYIKNCPSIWADLDSCSPSLMLLEPTIVIESSPARFQALWVLDEPTAPLRGEEISRRIAYYHAEQGADKSGWDLSQLLRVPYTPNYKYGDVKDAPIVSVLDAKKILYRPSDFDRYPATPALNFTQESVPLPSQQGEEADSIVERYHTHLHSSFFDTYKGVPPPNGWSTEIWRLLNQCREAGMNRDETFIVAKHSACNKFRRDGRPDEELWADVLRAFVKHIEKHNLVPTPSSIIPDFLTDDEVKEVQHRPTFVERYIDYAATLTDSPVAYHQAGAFIILSSILAGSVYLPTSFGKILLNMWFLLLANTTITRKTTAMNVAIKVLQEVNPDIMLATSGSIEGILTALRDRPRQPSIFQRDEFTGLLLEISNKDYMAGFTEMMTKLYDGDPVRRLLRKETIDVRDPIFIQFAAGIKDKTQMLITEEQVMSGFIPRYVMITAEQELENLRPMGPPVSTDLEAREMIKNELIDMHFHYTDNTKMTKDGKTIGYADPEFQASLTPEAWQRYNQFERVLTETALSTGIRFLTPVYDRLAKSTLKAATLIAASRQRERVVKVELLDIMHAIYYARQWRVYVSEIVNGIGKTNNELLIETIYDHTRKHSNGLTRAELMRTFKLDVSRADLIFGTMFQRQLLFIEEVAGRKRYKAAEVV